MDVVIRMDLTDEQIPMGAKIVSLADSFDAMTTDRPYRRRRSFEDVVRDLRENSGKQFDGKVVAAFARAILKEVTGETKERRITKMLGKGYLEGEHVATLLTDLIADLERRFLPQRRKGAKSKLSCNLCVFVSLSAENLPRLDR